MSSLIAPYRKSTLMLLAQTYGLPRCKRQLDDDVNSLHKRIQHVGALTTAKMETCGDR